MTENQSPAALAEALLEQVEQTRASAVASEILIDDLLSSLRDQFNPEAPPDHFPASLAEARRQVAETCPPSRRIEVGAGVVLVLASGGTAGAVLAFALGIAAGPLIVLGAALALAGWACCAAGAGR